MTDFDPTRGFISTRPANTWEEGLLCGNGTLGMNAFGRPHDETVIFTHEKMWLPCGAPTLPADMGPRLFEIRRLIDRGLYFEANQLAFDISGQGSFMYPDPFVPAFDLNVKTDGTGVDEYQRSVDFRSGEATVMWEDAGRAFQRRFFASRAHGVAVMEISGPDNGLTCSLSLEPRTPGNGMEQKKVDRSNDRFASHVVELETAASADSLTYSCAFTKAYPGSVKRLLGMTRVVSDGTSTIEGDVLSIVKATNILLIVGIDLLYGKEEDGVDALASRLEAVPTDYDALLSAHAERHGDLFSRVRLDLGGTEHDRPIEELLDEATCKNLNPTLVEKVFDAGRHNIISCTGEWPPALQGIWGGTYVPDWAGDYTHNGNVPSAISATLMGNTPELMLAYVDYLEWLVPYLEMNASRMFGARGIVLPSRTSTHGHNNALAPSFAGGFWLAGAAWAAHYFYDYWLYTGDRIFLRDRALPFMEKAALFFEDFLYEGADGNYVFSPTQSPENTPANSNSQASLNATMDVAAVKELLESLITASKRLDRNGEKVPVWKEMLRKMPDYMVNDEGIVKEWLTPKLENNDRHRHASHLYPLYDGLPNDVADSPKLMEAFKKTIRDKLDRHWSENSLGFMSFGVVQLGQAATSLREGEMAHECLVHLVNRYWLNNLGSMHNHKSLLNMDISGGLPSVIIKMLVASEPETIHLLPAKPEAWPTGTIEGVLCRGAVEVKRLSWTSESIEVTLVSRHDRTVAVTVPTEAASATCSDSSCLESVGGRCLDVRLPMGVPTSVRILL